MKRIILTLLFFLTFTFSAMAEPNTLYYSESDADSVIKMDQSTVAVIELWSNPSTGYGWRAKQPLGRTIRILGNEFGASKSGMLGTWVKEQIYVVGNVRGKSTLALEYRRAHSRKAVDTIKYNFDVSGKFTETFSISSQDMETTGQRERESEKEAAKALGLPTAFNWCDQNGCTPIRDQGNCGSCWAFATVGPFESMIKINDGDSVDLSEQYLVSCNSEGWGCNGGLWAHDYHEWKTVSGESGAGAVLERDFPYKGRDLRCDPPHDKSHQISSWEYVCGNSRCMPSDNELKQAIYDHGPLTVAVCVNNAFQNYNRGVFTGPNCRSLNHGVILVGWDDNDDCWIMRNSWGSSWGESGYMRISYGVSGIGSEASYVVYEFAPTPDPDPNPDPGPDPDPNPNPNGDCVTADNMDHIAAGRAEYCGFFGLRACAAGSGDLLGWAFSNYSEVTSIAETSSNYWERVNNCP